jgi:hypothetical protein
MVKDFALQSLILLGGTTARLLVRVENATRDGLTKLLLIGDLRMNVMIDWTDMRMMEKATITKFTRPYVNLDKYMTQSIQKCQDGAREPNLQMIPELTQVSTLIAPLPQRRKKGLTQRQRRRRRRNRRRRRSPMTLTIMI